MKRLGKRLGIVLGILVIGAACSNPETTAPATKAASTKKAPPPLTADAARATLAASPELGEFEFTHAAISLPMSGSPMSADARANAKDLERAGYVRVSGDAVSLTDKAKGDPRFVVRQNGFVDVVPIAKKELGSIGELHPTPDGIETTFTWRWVPTEIGRAFTKGPASKMFEADHQNKATLIYDGTQWTVLRID